MNSLRFLLILVLFITALATGQRTAIAQQVRDEKIVKAVWLYRFGQHVTWPNGWAPTADGTFIIGVLGPNPFDDNLNKLVAGREIRKQKVLVRNFAAVKDYQPCHVLFISPLAGKAAEKNPQARLAALRGVVHKHTLIVSDGPGLAGAGAMINYSIDNVTGVINLEINRQAVKAAQLEIGGGLLGLKEIVKIVP